MSERARTGRRGGQGTLSAPGALSSEDGAAAAAPQGLLPDEPLPELAARYGLEPSAARPSPLAYLKQLWQRRHFVVAFATARNVAMYSEARLGQVWQILTPLLNAAVYFLIFGVILDTKRGVPNFIPFLVTGVFIFNFTQRSFIIASRVINDSLPLIRALHFPRACLPLGYVLIELQQMAISMVVLIVIVLGFGEPLTWYWLLAVPALALQTLLQRRGGAHPRPHRRRRGRRQPADPVHRAHLDVRVRGHVLHPRAGHPVPARQAELPAADQPGRRSTSRWSGTRC